MATIVIVPGALHGGWRWKEVRVALQAAGHEVYALTLTGLGRAQPPGHVPTSAWTPTSRTW